MKLSKDLKTKGNVRETYKIKREMLERESNVRITLEKHPQNLLKPTQKIPHEKISENQFICNPLSARSSAPLLF